MKGVGVGCEGSGCSSAFTGLSTLAAPLSGHLPFAAEQSRASMGSGATHHVEVGAPSREVRLHLLHDVTKGVLAVPSVMMVLTS